MAKAKTEAAAKSAPKEKTSALAKPLSVSKELEAVIGKGPMPRTEVVKKLWEYIKKHKLQDDKNKRLINADAALEKVFGVKSCDMFQMTKLVSAHLT